MFPHSSKYCQMTQYRGLAASYTGPGGYSPGGFQTEFWGSRVIYSWSKSMFDADFISGPPNLLYSGVTAATVDIYYMSLCLEQLFLNYEYIKSCLTVFFLLVLLAFHWNLLFAIVPQRPSLYMILLGSHSKFVSRNFFRVWKKVIFL